MAFVTSDSPAPTLVDDVAFGGFDGDVALTYGDEEGERLLWSFVSYYSLLILTPYTVP